MMGRGIIYYDGPGFVTLALFPRLPAIIIKPPGKKQMEVVYMTREEIYQEIEKQIGEVPTWFKYFPDAFLEYEFNDFKVGMSKMMEDTAIPKKWRDLINLGIATAAQDKYGILWCTESAKLSGASDEEIKETVYLTKGALGWNSFLKGNQVDYEDFKKETLKAFKKMRDMGMAKTMGEREKVSI